MKLPLLGPVSLTGFQNAWFFFFLLIVLFSPDGMIGLWRRLVERASRSSNSSNSGNRSGH